MGVKVSKNGPDLREITRRCQLAINNTVPAAIKREAIAFFKQSFTNQGFIDKIFVPWAPRKGERVRVSFGEKFKYSAKEKESRGILIKTGALRRSIFGRIMGKKIYILSDSPYAAIHNEGGYAGRGNKARIPRRKFIGESATMNNIISNICFVNIKKCFRP